MSASIDDLLLQVRVAEKFNISPLRVNHCFLDAYEYRQQEFKQLLRSVH